MALIFGVITLRISYADSKLFYVSGCLLAKLVRPTLSEVFLVRLQRPLLVVL